MHTEGHCFRTDLRLTLPPRLPIPLPCSGPASIGSPRDFWLLRFSCALPDRTGRGISIRRIKNSSCLSCVQAESVLVAEEVHVQLQRDSQSQHPARLWWHQVHLVYFGYSWH